MSSQMGAAADLCWPSGKPFPLEPQVSHLHNQTASFSYLRARLKGTAVLLWRASPGLGIPPFSSFPGSQAFWERGTEFFLGKSHLPGEKGSLWVGDGPTPQHHADKPQPPGSCRAAKLPYLSWYFESGGSHARLSKGWLCASVLGREMVGRGEPERLRSRFQGLGLQRGESWPPGGPPSLNIQGVLGVSPRLGGIWE